MTGMFVFGVCVGNWEKFERFAESSIRSVSPEAPILTIAGQTSIFEAYNKLRGIWLEKYADTEGLILIHEDVELKAAPEESVRFVLRDKSIGLVGAVGGRGVRTAHWVRCAEKVGRAPDTFYGENDFGGGTQEADLVDGLFLALSPEVVRLAEFDSSTFSGFHAYDSDLSMTVKSLGLRVVVSDIELLHHTKGGFGDVRRHRTSDDAFRKKWGLPLDSWGHRLIKRVRGLPY